MPRAGDDVVRALDLVAVLSGEVAVAADRKAGGVQEVVVDEVVGCAGHGSHQRKT